MTEMGWRRTLSDTSLRMTLTSSEFRAFATGSHTKRIKADLPYEVDLLRVPEGQEEWKISSLYRDYYHVVWREFPYPRAFTITTNHLLSIADSDGGTMEIELSEFHQLYRSLLGFEKPLKGAQPRILVLDTGIAPTATVHLAEAKNFVEEAHPLDAADDNGHGTVICAIIADCLPEAELIVYKVADAKGRASEWDVLAALGAARSVDVVNMSLVFGLAARDCPLCGRVSHSSRAAVFEYFIQHLTTLQSPPVLVAAAGNASKDELSYPARFGDVIAVGSVTSERRLSRFSNWGIAAHAHGPHKNRFVLPGGDTAAPDGLGEEFVATMRSDGKRFHGTSFAAAYASAIVAAMRLRLALGPVDLLHALRGAADQTFPGYDYALHGNGFLRLT